MPWSEAIKVSQPAFKQSTPEHVRIISSGSADCCSVQVTPVPKQKLDVSQSQDSAAKSIATAKREVSSPKSRAKPAEPPADPARVPATLLTVWPDSCYTLHMSGELVLFKTPSPAQHQQFM